MVTKARSARDQPNTSPGTISRSEPVERDQEAIDLGVLRALEQIADPVVTERDPVERRQRPERPLLDAQEEAAERRLPVGRVPDRPRRARRSACRDRRRPPGTCEWCRLWRARQEPKLIPHSSVIATCPQTSLTQRLSRQRVVAGVVPREAHGQQRDRRQRRQQQPRGPDRQEHHREVRGQEQRDPEQQLAHPEVRRGEQAALFQVVVQLTEELRGGGSAQKRGRHSLLAMVQPKSIRPVTYWSCIGHDALSERAWVRARAGRRSRRSAGRRRARERRRCASGYRPRPARRRRPRRSARRCRSASPRRRR